MDKKAVQHLIMLALLLTLQGCTYSTVTEYKDCVSPELTFDFKDNVKLYALDDSAAEIKYSRMNINEGEFYLCTGSDCHSYPSSKFKYIPLQSVPFHLTGKYRTSEPNIILGTFVSETSALQADINGTIVWMSLHEFEKHQHKKEVENSIIKLKRNSTLQNGWHLRFECPNNDVQVEDWWLYSLY